MAINKPIIVGQPAVERRTVFDQSFSPRHSPPTESYLDVVDDVAVRIPAVSPEREGQLSFTMSADASDLNRSCTIYVVVDIDGTLVWKQVTPVPVFISQYTGKPFDPIYD